MPRHKPTRQSQKPTRPRQNLESKNLQAFLDSHYQACNTASSLVLADPLIIVREHTRHPHFAEIALLCALLSYGSARQIVAFLRTLDFTLLDSHDLHALHTRKGLPYYRFQSAEDIGALFGILRECIRRGGIKEVFAYGLANATYTPYRVLNAIYHAIATLREIAREIGAQSRGVEFALGAGLDKNIESKTASGASKSHKPHLGLDSLTQTTPKSFSPKGKSPLKRWNLFVRWMVRDDALDFGIWRDMLDPSELIIPLDTHTFKVGQNLGLLTRKSYDLAAALELTDSLRRFSPTDPVRYDFALYRIGQTKRDLPDRGLSATPTNALGV